MVQYTDLVSDTICAQITPQGYSGVCVIRVSGDSALKATKKLCPQLTSELQSHKAYLTKILNPESGEEIDQVLVTYFAKGSSFTGDEVIEIACHGSPVISQKIMSLYLHSECRVAERGEFTFRAFYNGKIDLVQAESINHLVTSKSETSSQSALKNLNGDLSQIYKGIEKGILHILAHLEAAIDFVEQDIDPNSYRNLESNYSELLGEVEQLIESYDIGKKLTEDWRVLLVGETNVGKSSLFNSFFQHNHAIVTSTPGTTRDLVQENQYVGNHSVRFIDSAGLRKNPEEIEQLGIEKTMDEVKKASVLLWVVDGSQEIPWNIFERLNGQNLIIVLNKIDLIGANLVGDVVANIKTQSQCEQVYPVSVKLGTGLQELQQGLQKMLDVENQGDYKAIVTHSRHYSHLQNLQERLSQSLSLLKNEESPDLISQELQGGLSEVQKLLGKTFDDDILATIFSEFCIGK